MIASNRKRRRGRAGYTVVELMMSLAVLAVGTAGVFAMQKVTLAANRHARSLTVATRVAEAWADQLTADATLWTTGPTPRSKTAWLNKADPTGLVDWLIPEWSDKRLFGPGFDSLGSPVDTKKTPSLAHFCTHLRFTGTNPEQQVVDGLMEEGNGAVRVQVRIFWRRDDTVIDPAGGSDPCAVSAAEFETAEEAYHAVYLTTVVREAAKGRI